MVSMSFCGLLGGPARRVGRGEGVCGYEASLGYVQSGREGLQGLTDMNGDHESENTSSAILDT